MTYYTKTLCRNNAKTHFRSSMRWATVCCCGWRTSTAGETRWCRFPPNWAVTHCELITKHWRYVSLVRGLCKADSKLLSMNYYYYCWPHCCFLRLFCFFFFCRKSSKSCWTHSRRYRLFRSCQLSCWSTPNPRRCCCSRQARSRRGLRAASVWRPGRRCTWSWTGWGCSWGRSARTSRSWRGDWRQRTRGRSEKKRPPSCYLLTSSFI